MTNWRDLSTAERAVALHEAGHGVIGELLDWKVKYLRLFDSGGGVCRFIKSATVPWVDLIVSGAGHAAEMYYRGRVWAGGSYSDRTEAQAVVELAGLEMWDSPFAAAEVERRLWPVFTAPAVSAAVRRVARALGRRAYLSRRKFLALTDSAIDDETRRNVRRFCRRTALEVLEKHLEEQGT